MDIVTQEIYFARYFYTLGVYPPIVDGPMYGAFHGIIQMAYGLACGSDEMVVEGIAWSHQQYSPMYMDNLNNPKVSIKCSDFDGVEVSAFHNSLLHKFRFC